MRLFCCFYGAVDWLLLHDADRRSDLSAIAEGRESSRTCVMTHLFLLSSITYMFDNPFTLHFRILHLVIVGSESIAFMRPSSDPLLPTTNMATRTGDDGKAKKKVLVVGAGAAGKIQR